MTTTDLATRRQPTLSGEPAAYLEALRPEIERALPKHLDGDRIARLALTLIRQSHREAMKIRKPENSLANCTPESFAGALLTASALGLEPGVGQEAYLVPYKGECTLIIGYQGYAKLFWQHPLARHLDAHAVHERDEFDYAYGLAQFLRHKPARGDRGKITDYYAVAELSTGASSFVVLSAAEVKALRGGKVGPSGQIPDPMHWMERKTALRQLVKLLPKSSMLLAAMAVDEHSGRVLAEQGVPAALSDGGPMPALPMAQWEDVQQQRVTASEILGGSEPSGGDPASLAVPVSAPDGGAPPEDVSADGATFGEVGASSAEAITGAQMKKLHALLNETGYDNRDEALAFLSSVIGRDIDTSKALSKDEASLCIEALLRLTPPDDREPDPTLDGTA